MALSPMTASILVSTPQQFTVTPTNTAVTWSVVGGNTNGTISTNGLYTAPSTAGTYSVTATNVADPTVSITATITVTPNVAVGISPKTPSIVASATQQFTASVTGSTNHAVTWSVVGGNVNGTITSAGLYTAPSTAGTYSVTVTSVADPTKTDMATVTVNPNVAVGISPKTPSILASTSQQFTVSVTGTTNHAVTWSVAGGNANGTITSAGLYTAPIMAGTYQVTVTSVADPTKSDTATVTVNPNIAVVISPKTVDVSTTQQFTASVTGTTNLAVTWSVAGGNANGTITSTGLYTAPSTAGTYQVTATSVADPTKSDTATVTVEAMAITVQ
jgi:hypothetical protein